MKNIVVYTDKKVSTLADTLAQIDESNVRIEDAANLRDYETLNPGLIVIENVPDIKDVLMVLKFKVPVLFIGEVFKGSTVRSVAFDFIKTPVDNLELVIRAKCLLKIKELRDKIPTLSPGLILKETSLRICWPSTEYETSSTFKRSFPRSRCKSNFTKGYFLEDGLISSKVIFSSCFFLEVACRDLDALAEKRATNSCNCLIFSSFLAF